MTNEADDLKTFVVNGLKRLATLDDDPDVALGALESLAAIAGMPTRKTPIAKAPTSAQQNNFFLTTEDAQKALSGLTSLMKSPTEVTSEGH